MVPKTTLGLIKFKSNFTGLAISFLSSYVGLAVSIFIRSNLSESRLIFRVAKALKVPIRLLVYMKDVFPSLNIDF